MAGPRFQRPAVADLIAVTRSLPDKPPIAPLGRHWSGGLKMRLVASRAACPTALGRLQWPSAHAEIPCPGVLGWQGGRAWRPRWQLIIQLLSSACIKDTRQTVSATVAPRVELAKQPFVHPLPRPQYGGSVGNRASRSPTGSMDMGGSYASQRVQLWWRQPCGWRWALCVVLVLSVWGCW